ncbi:MAG: 16S rRNA (guanine(966)-N(2))-methyltransferase RsmD [Bergeyella sp.]|nr:16S rRNA (guanine(966)-N(2))-methyltransferase RsmD [Bergeyella sp.]
MYRIISGKWKSKKIIAPKNFEVRPTTDFAKEALFDILGNRYSFDSCSVLDLFSGLGSISLEFASRGCTDVTLIDTNAKHIQFVSAMASDLEMNLSLNFVRTDAYDWLKKNKYQNNYNIIFADPPFESTSQHKYEELIHLILKNAYLRSEGTFVLEHSSKISFQHSSLIDRRKYGNVSFSFFSPV